MPISFDLATFKNTFPGEIIESDVIPGNQGQEFLRIVIAELNHNFEKQESTQKCNFGDCSVMIRHRHQPALWESEKSGSPLHMFVESVNLKGQVNTKTSFSFKDFIGKRWTFEGVKSRDYPDPQNPGQTKIGRTYYYVSGPLDAPIDVDMPEPMGDSLPFNAGSVQTPTNGTALKPSTEDLDLILATYVDGKTMTQLIQGIMMKEEVPEITASDDYLAHIIDQSNLTRLTEKGWITKDGDIFKSSDEVKALAKD